ncbi:MAG TPA: pyrroline-5-carboxylate reductase [Hyphomicrobiaceae bacterium]|nr:pyrroline-5-carboxylate reductase [Hyphomicrobiaceae bacterium]
MNSMIRLDGPLVLAGAGNMGGAMLAGWLARGLAPAQIIVQDPGPPPATAELLAKHGVRTMTTIDSLPTPPAVLLMAVKPQVMDDVFAPLAKLAGPSTVVLSIAAGRTIASFEKFLPPRAAVVRSIPNTPAAVGRGITVAAANTNVTERHKQTVTELLSAIGEVAWVDDEALIDPVTAVSGSGPAYVFYMVEALAAAGVAAGLKPELAMQLARATVTGAGELLHQSPLDAATLRQNVTSPNGTTYAALQVLMAKDGLEPLMTAAVAAATKRSRELAQ